MWDYARSAGPIIGQAAACGAPADRVAKADAQVRELLSLSAKDADEHRKADELFDFMRAAAVTEQTGAPGQGACPEALVTFTDLERRLPAWRSMLGGR